MKGKVCLITGATAGIGRVTARELARLGAIVILVGRNRERGRQAVAAIRQETGNHAVEFMAADLSAQAEVRTLARHFLSRHSQLHVLINNAGAFHARRRESVDGIEMTLALNHLAPFLLTNLLLDALRAAAPARIINVSSEAHDDVKAFDFDDPQALRRGFGSYPRSELSSAFYALALPMAHPGFLQYARSKLANLLFTAELTQRLAGGGVTANSLHPGVVASEFGAGNGLYGWFLQRMLRMRGISVEAGAQTLIYLATAQEVESVTGEYFIGRRSATCSSAARDPIAAARLWQLSEQLTRA